VSSVTDSAWAAGIRRERRSEALLVLGELTALAGWFLLRRDPARVPGPTWAGLAAITVFLLVLQGRALRPTRRRTLQDGHRVRYAIRAHVDPGPRLRGVADAYAERRATTWSFWLLLLWLPQAVSGRWHQPAVAVPSAVLLAAGLAGTIFWYRRLAAASRRWLDDPPGRAPRPPYVPPPDQRPWTITWRQGALLVALVVGVTGALVAASQWFG
jgi:hypothetical protein